MIALDFETYLISESQPIPRPVCLSSYDGQQSQLMVGEDMEKFLLTIPRDQTWVFTNARFDLSVIWEHITALQDEILERIRNGTILCTKISEQLIDFARKDPTFKADLASCVQIYYDKDISEGKKDGWRTCYSELDGVPLSEWPEEAVNYAKEDAYWTYMVALKQERTDRVSVSMDFFMALATARGIKVHKENTKKLQKATYELATPLQASLVDKGMATISNKGKFSKKKKEFQLHLLNTQRRVQYTEKGGVSTSKKILPTYKPDPVIDMWLEYMTVEKVMSTFLPPLLEAEEAVRATFNPLVRTGRTSSSRSNMYPSVNLQQMPRSVPYSDVGVRECFQSRERFKLISIDYASLELCCVAQQTYNVYGKSNMLDKLNYGKEPVDLHSMTGAMLLSIDSGKEVPYEWFVKHKKNPNVKKYRTLAKPINLGYPGGIGPATMRQTAFDTYGVRISEEEAVNLRKLFYREYPELNAFLRRDIKQLRTGENIQWKNKSTGKVSEMPEFAYKAGSVLRRGCSLTAAANGFLMQSLAAAGAKAAIDRIGLDFAKRDDVHILGFIHDEILFEVKEDIAEDMMSVLSEYMIDAMQEYLPDVRVTVEADLMDVWSKEGGEVSGLYWKNPKEDKLYTKS